MKLPIYYDADTCKKCGGECCKSTPGETFPSQWQGDDGIDWNRVEEALRSDLYIVDWWDGDPSINGDGDVYRAYFLRPNVKNYSGPMAPESSGAIMFGFLLGPPHGIAGECALLGEDGCTLPREQVPLGCQWLEPRGGGGRCTPTAPEGYRNSKQLAAVEWLPYSDDLYAVAMRLLS